MITATPLTRQPKHWQRALSEAITDPADLIAALNLDPAFLEPARRAADRFGLKVPRGFLARMRPGDPDDPLLRQVLPLGDELDDYPGFVSDPVGDLASRKRSGLLHKYQGRALLITTGACALHCRYCFRREFPYSENIAAAGNWQPALDALAADPGIEELLLSGGDPLSLSDRKLKALTDGLGALPHIKRLRLHTRQPVVLPERIDAGFSAWFSRVTQQKIVVIHANHPNEIDASVRDALARVKDCGATLLNQSVLLKGVNDDSATLAALSESLFDAGVLPYYLHLLDPVRGAGHFDVDATRAAELTQALARRLPGYLVPRLVREVPGAPYKQPMPW
jgi:EF-P beta-lysylation protein EpmB